MNVVILATPSTTPPQQRQTTRGVAGSPDTSSSQGRKRPCCTHCGRPRKGHPSSGCPYKNPPILPKIRGNSHNPPQPATPTTAPPIIIQVQQQQLNQDNQTEHHRVSDTAGPSRRTRAAPLRREKTEEDLDADVRSVLRIAPGSPVYILNVASEDLPGLLRAVQGLPNPVFHACVVRPKEEKADDEYGMFIFGPDARVVERHDERVREAVAKGLSFEAVANALGLVCKTVKDVVAAWKAVQGR